MKGLDRPFLVLLATLALLACFPLAMPSSSAISMQLDPRFQALPMQLGEWAGEETPVDDLTYQILETRNVLSRLYQNPEGERIHLLLVSSSKDRRVAHPPEVCYTSSNFSIVRSGERSIRVGSEPIQVKEFVAENERNPEHRENVLYLYQVGERYTTNYYAQQFQFALDALARKDSQVLLIRLAGPSDKAFPDFLETILPFVSN